MQNSEAQDPKRAAAHYGDGAKAVVRSVAPQFRHGNFDLAIVDRFNDIAIYRKTKGEYTGYEVVRITRRPPHPFDTEKDLYDRVEHYPGNEEWGIYGWTFQTLEVAQLKAFKLWQHRETRQGAMK